MTQVIDHAIQIPVSTPNMWNLVSNPENNPRWQLDCVQVSFLNSIRRGIGMRWRYKAANGKEQVAEITAWYEGLGFEYTIVDGSAFTANKGRIRLQEVPEGTIVQWTFSYEPSGFVARVRNSVSTRRSLDYHIVESLRNLFRVAKEMYREADLKDSRALMRDAPNVQERSEYRPRYPSVLEEGRPRPVATPGSAMPPVTVEPAVPANSLYQRPAITEPPVADDDTRPNPVLAGPAAAAPQESVVSQPPAEPALPPTPSFVPARPAESPSLSEAIAAVEPPPQEVEHDTAGEKALTSLPGWPAVSAETAPVVEAPAPPLPQADPAPAPAAPEPEVKTPEPLASFSAPPEPVQPRIDLNALDKRDTSTISVFELFGLPRPSQTQEMRAVTLKPEEPSAADETITTRTTEEYKVAGVVTASMESAPATTSAEPVPAPSMLGAAPSPADFAAFASGMKAADITYQAPRIGLRRRLRQKLISLRTANKKGAL
jgi:hypothetical protein